MAYILNKSNGSILVKVEDGSIDRSTSLTFVGKNYAGYGEVINENLLKLLENFSNKTPPTNPISGQLWYDSLSKQLNVYNGTVFSKMSVIETSSTLPATLTNVGDFWFNTSEKKLYIKSSNTPGINGYTFVGPVGSTGNADSVIPASVVDEDKNTRYVLKHVVNGYPVAVSSAEEFVLSTADPLYGQFTLVKKGITLSGTNASSGDSAASGVYFWGTAASALKLGDYRPEDFLLKSAYDSGSTNGLRVETDNGIIVGTDGILRIHANTGEREGKITVEQGTKLSVSLRYPTLNDTVKKMLVVDGNKLLPGDVPLEIGTPANQINYVYARNADATTLTAFNVAVSGKITTATPAITDNSTTVATTEFVRKILPRGIILMWSGSRTTVPAGWALCNGQNGTPDLRDRFVMSAGTIVENTTGGANSATTTAGGDHNHTGTTGAHALTTDQIPSHSHNMYYHRGTENTTGATDDNGLLSISSDTDAGYYTNTSVVQPTGGSKTHSHTIEGSGSHQHTVSTIPSYYALCYIMKL